MKYYFILNPTALRIVGVLLICILPFVGGCNLYYHNYGKTFYAYKNTQTELKFKTKSIKPNLKVSMYVSAMGRSVKFGVIPKESTLKLVKVTEKPKTESSANKNNSITNKTESSTNKNNSSINKTESSTNKK